MYKLDLNLDFFFLGHKNLLYELKFHQYKKEVRKGRKIGHVTVIGNNLLELTEVVEHARDYMSGEIDE